MIFADCPLTPTEYIITHPHDLIFYHLTHHHQSFQHLMVRSIRLLAWKLNNLQKHCLNRYRIKCIPNKKSPVLTTAHKSPIRLSSCSSQPLSVWVIFFFLFFSILPYCSCFFAYMYYPTQLNSIQFNSNKLSNLTQ